MREHARSSFFVVGEGVLETDDQGEPRTRQPTSAEELRRFRFSRLGPKGPRTDEDLRVALATAITDAAAQPDSTVPAGFTYLGQFVDHDLTMDRTETQLGTDLTVDELVQGRSPALDLDSLYGRGPGDRDDRRFYAEDRVKLKVGTTAAVTVPDERVNVDLAGFDLPRVGGIGGTAADRRAALIPDPRNDENLAVAQTHLAFIRFHNRVVEQLAITGVGERRLFETAREQVVKHYQWLLRTDFLPRVVDPAVVEDVFAHGRRFFEAHGHHGGHGGRPTMPVEFAVAAYRIGHSMIRSAYQWNRVFSGTGPAGVASLLQLFTFSGTSGNFRPGSGLPDLDDPNAAGLERLPTNWIVDFRRLYDFTEAGRPDLAVPPGAGNVTKRIDSLLVDPLTQLPAGSFGGRGTEVPAIERNLAFRNLTRAEMVELASGQQMAELFGVEPLTAAQILEGDSGAALADLTEEQRDALVAATPLWFYALREAELNGGLLGPVGGRVVVEVFHRAMEGSRHSIVREPSWRPALGPDSTTFRMTDLLLFAFEGKLDLLNPLGD
ncbi:heme peroxidase family protein [Actinokineospora sp. NBRC 105648]|uniref:peroxidase family protein n=1 Tax=Actinokineospora sp. NBRC 105648 TaxID=3032206 RepID=UPI0024A37A87|nr:heme peroxidase family protein [Actinokineospora sp. NBRC 105648]GLZ36907.1 myeloperoxidase [Actinokineospora sp. NBRC 105648]